MKRIVRLTAVCLAVLLACTAFTGCFGSGKKLPEKEVVDHVYKYDTKELIMLENPSYENEEDFTGRSYIGVTAVDADGYLYTVNTVDSNHNTVSQIAYIGNFDSDEVTEISLPAVADNENEYRGIQNIIRFEDGILTTVYESKVVDAENGVYEQKYLAEIYGSDGTLCQTLDFKQIFGIEGEESYLNISELCFAGGDLFLTVYTSLEEYNNKLVRLGLDGTIKEVIALLPEGIDGYVGSMRAVGDDKICVPMEIYSENSYSQKLMLIDLASGTQTEVDAGDDYRIMYQSFGGADGELYYTGDSGINHVDPLTGETTELMNFINSDYIYNYGSFYAINSEKFVTINSEYEDEKIVLSLTTFEKVPDDQLIPKYLITVASAGGAYNFRDQIVEFNLASEEYRIKYIDYSEYNTDEDYTAGQTKLQNDILAGNVPDVLITDQEFSASKYANKGLFVDLYTYMDKDPELPRSAFLENVLTACETNGKLYEIPTNIYIMGFMGYKDTISEFANLTMREFYEKVQSLPEGVSFFRDGDYSRDNMLEVMFFLSYVNFIDPATGLCDLDNDDFKAMLEYVNTLPEKTKYEMEDFDWETYDYEAYENMFKDGKAIAEWMSLNSFTSFADNGYYFGAKEVDFIGAPAPDRDGMVFTATNLKFLISDKGNFPDQAWEFVKIFFTEENQRELGWGFPVIKSALDAEKQEALDDIAKREAEEANKAESEDTSIDGTVTEGIITSEGVVIKPVGPIYEERYATREDVETIYNYVTGVKKQLLYDSSIFDIIKEEASEYFAGKKSLDAVAASAESRVNIKLGEAM